MPASTRSISVAPARRHAAGIPGLVRPMLAKLSDLPADASRYSFEFKWDGVRAITYWDRRTLRILSRNNLEIAGRYPELHALGEALGDHAAVVDGEIVALDENDRPSFSRLQKRMHLKDPKAVARLMRDVPVYYFIFDLLWLDGKSLMDRPLIVRRQMLEDLTLIGPSWQVPPAHVGQGKAMLKAARATGLEGLVAKRLDSAYEPDGRSGAWLKIKVVRRQEFVVGGWIPMAGSRRGIGSLLVGYFDPTGKRLLYAGRVGTGFKGPDHRLLGERLERLKSATNPFGDSLVRTPSRFGGLPPISRIHFVWPELVVDVEFRRWPAEGLIQQAAYKGLRTDKLPREVVKEEQSCTDAKTHEDDAR